MSSTSRPSWRATGYGVGHLLMAVPLALLLSWAAICLGLAVIGVGIPLARPLGPAIAVLARANARMGTSSIFEAPRWPVAHTPRPHALPPVKGASRRANRHGRA